MCCLKEMTRSEVLVFNLLLSRLGPYRFRSLCATKTADGQGATVLPAVTLLKWRRSVRAPRARVEPLLLVPSASAGGAAGLGTCEVSHLRVLCRRLHLAGVGPPLRAPPAAELCEGPPGGWWRRSDGGGCVAVGFCFVCQEMAFFDKCCICQYDEASCDVSWSPGFLPP